ncbi:hypothetical protein [Phyllobacterium endophyticum]|uniref:Uncharacterized protein n=1 Tax=Phyllobacterium endophyticum TaxID=1149773 RepID=A0A2P7B1A2_9HYPH|nr:hypothetical protein [Phyllobacterium endophyticum]MBB3237799.1 hypothetical protein [Phyllobacterium endophyticum]PSH60247.1 hypothetical protein CU100_05995 [Phyllobacterium endophyticum]TXR48706.1 hypothetical protein FVA77_13790 [Phyllobacterium endophyticum]TYR42417.1 hypothetical protein FY050_14555 [Phyllobacterium endophyticum]
MKIFFLPRAFAKWLRASRTRLGDTDCGNWKSDPLAHPVLQAMDLDQLADLPFNPCEVRRQ